MQFIFYIGLHCIFLKTAYQICSDWGKCEMKCKLYKYRMRILIKINGILHTSRCTAKKVKTSLRHTFF